MEFFTSGSILKQINHAVNALVPKSTHTPSVGDYRSISCCNVIYKVITKILASRLRPILGDIVDQAQAAFIEGRSMMENIHLVQELMREYNRKRLVGDFLKSALEGLNFPLRFVQWIMECITTPTYSIALIGSIHGFFKGGQGLRQGDPLFPFLFVFCLEYFSRMIKDATNDSDFNYHPKCGPLKITHLAFADDLMLFTRGDAMFVEIFMNCLDKFGLTLGISLVSEKLKVSFYATLLEKIAAYIGAWNCSSLSYADKVELIRVVFQGVEWGLGLKDLKSWNLALTAKSHWNIQHKKDTLWIRWVHQERSFSTIHEKGVAQQILTDGKLRALGQMDAGIILSRHAGLAPNYLSGHAQNMDQTGQNLDSHRDGQIVRFDRQFLGFLEQFLGYSAEDKFSTKISYNFFRPKGTFKTWGPEVWKLHLSKTCDHLFFKCFFTSKIWGNVRQWLGIKRSMTTLVSALKWLKKEAHGTSWLSKVKRIALASTVYYIWLTWNRKIFEDLSTNLDCIVRQIKTHVYKVMFTSYPDVLIHFEAIVGHAMCVYACLPFRCYWGSSTGVSLEQYHRWMGNLPGLACVNLQGSDVCRDASHP
ncbi:uncharacterized protein LOC111374969 [Olea europaea var. sylvestris]|uniref:uncharacterized protein LOC111374969 n=1 Tax=Olea europaea var. sylvestris TaxID=158386 RepID=UPI000C1CEB04|nr:uncharacterized protein LOC111374969 [Olea europaea var. sylvestris]